jgi:hypothetical protein
VLKEILQILQQQQAHLQSSQQLSKSVSDFVASIQTLQLEEIIAHSSLQSTYRNDEDYLIVAESDVIDCGEI